MPEGFSRALIYLQGDGALVSVPPPAIIEPEGDWRVEFPHTHLGGARPDWSVSFGYGTLYEEFNDPVPYVVVQYDGLYGAHWHELTIEQVSGLMAQLGAMLQHTSIQSQDRAARDDESG